MIRSIELTGGRLLDFSGPCLVMAIVNCNEDSFYAPSRASAQKAVEKALLAAGEGADVIDFGAESTRPGAAYISEDEEIRRLIPVIEVFRKRSALPVSVDTRKAAVAKAALDAGADIVNDISALEDDPLMTPLCAERGAPVILMHKKGEPQNMQDFPIYRDAAAEVKAFLLSRAEAAVKAGILKSRIILDPGIGFGKRLEHNIELISRLAEIGGNDYPVMAALSRKSFLGELTGRDVSGRLAGTIAANAAAIMRGAKIIRVHDVKEGADLARVLYAVEKAVK